MITLHCEQTGAVLVDDLNIEKQMNPSKDGKYSIIVKMTAIRLNILNKKDVWYQYNSKSTIRDIVISLTKDMFKGIKFNDFELFK